MIAIARALAVDAKVLILDEPTSSLDEAESDELFRIMEKLRNAGMGIIFVTHFLDQVYRVSDAITVLRNGKLVGEFPAAELPKLELIGKMVGKIIDEVRELEKRPESTTASGRKTVISVRRIGKKGSVAPLDLDLEEGEILGLAGLLGSGRSETANLLFGVDKADSGEVTIDGKTVAGWGRFRVNNAAFFCKFVFSTPAIVSSTHCHKTVAAILFRRQHAWKEKIAQLRPCRSRCNLPKNNILQRRLHGAGSFRLHFPAFFTIKNHSKHVRKAIFHVPVY